MSEAKDFSSENVAAGLDDTLGTLAEIWRNSPDSEHRARVMRALHAVNSAKDTMAAADALLLAKTRGERVAAMEALQKAAIFRVKDGARRAYE